MSQSAIPQQNFKQESESSYDDVPYDSYPYKQSSIEHLAAIGKLFGMQPPAVETARVLELGSAEGGNLIPYGERYPKGHFVGIDLSEKQIADGQKLLEHLQLDNVELMHMSILDIDQDFGEFDYIICHGVLSWVPDEVVDKILQICKENLSENGIAYISYNTLPGWNMVRTIRDMMLYHTQDIESPENRLTQARAMIDFVKESLEGSTAPHSLALATEADLLSKLNDSYLTHDHLGDCNRQFYFHEFNTMASNQGLRYLADAFLSSMYPGNISQRVANSLEPLNDLVRIEQYMDFITNRRFRSSLLCHSAVQLNRTLDTDRIKMFALSSNLTAQSVISPETIRSDATVKFIVDDDSDRFVETASPELKAILYVLSENFGFPLQFESIIEKANQKFTEDRSEKLAADLLQNGINLVIRGILNIALSERAENFDSNYPKISQLAHYQAVSTANLWVTNRDHYMVNISPFEKLCMGYMTGDNSQEQIIDSISKRAINKEIELAKENVELTEENIRSEVAYNVDLTIRKMIRTALLV